MTTTLRPAEPLQRQSDGTRSRHYQVCVNSRPVGTIHLATSPSLGPTVAQVTELAIDEPDRGRGRGTVAALTAEEVARGWGCRQIEATVPPDATAALRLFDALGYRPRNRNMAKQLTPPPPELPPAYREHPMSEAEFTAWLAYEAEEYVRGWTERGLPEEVARAKSRRDHETVLPDGRDSAGMVFSVLEHEGVRVGTLWLALREDRAFVYDVEADGAHRGRGHGRALMLLAERRALAAGRAVLGLNVFAGNTPAERLYTSLGYATTSHTLAKPLL
ncbi:GNAT family N-acetyltransferase [Streptomyces sp. J2-1]|uniref:GNAT family N-acetyltransferase n=1 Tax=Streptomyces corallincola TaxID=2851888 RepID=UPI001C394423|nr:GNAT family N-acetyltransferase [Streptomyces corallincola]MBV2354447.1 GNAT family N-acetyltransferase [Streptomyces corallincola]